MSASNGTVGKEENGDVEKGPLTLDTDATGGDTGGDTDATDEDPQVSMMTKIFWFGFFASASVSMVVLNKFSIMQLNQPYSILLFQNSMTILLNLVGIQVGVFKVNKFEFKQFKTFFLPSSLFVAMLTFSLMAYRLVSIATVVISRATSTLLVATGDYFFFGKQFAMQEVLFLGLVLFGAFTFAVGDMSSNYYGYLMTALNMGLFVFIQLYEKFQITHSDQTPVGISCVQNLISVPILVICVILSKEDLFEAITKSTDPQTTSICLILTGFAGCALSIVYMSLNKMFSATAISLGGNFNKLVSIFIGLAIFSNRMTMQQFFGLSLSMGGTFMFSQIQRKKKARKT